MTASESKKGRMLGLFYRLMRGENISPKMMAQEYGVSAKSISRDMNEIKNFLSDSRDLVGNAEIRYISGSKVYCLELENGLLSKELILIIKMLMACRAIDKAALSQLISKLKAFTAGSDKEMIEKLIIKEMFHYQGVKHQCDNLVELVWKLTNCIYTQKEITVSYYKMDGSRIERRLLPLSIMFSEFYFYLIADVKTAKDSSPHYYRVDRITKVIEHRETFSIKYAKQFDEGDLRKKVQLMFPGINRKIKFEFSGPSVQAILDRLPMSRIVEKKGEQYIIEAETYGTGINRFLLSQGAWVKVLEPESLVAEMKREIDTMFGRYC